MKRATREWIGKAEDDFRAAEVLARSIQPLHDQVCFHCQQSAEKYLKELGLSVHKTHDLGEPLTALLPHFPSLNGLRRGLNFLTNFAVGVRYPGDRATKRQAVAARRWAGSVRENCRTLLGIHPPRRGRRKSPRRK